MTRARARGFTLIELLVAVAIGALALAAAHAVLVQLADGSAAVARAAAASDRAGNADRLLRSTVGQLEVRPVTGPDVDGTESTLRFGTWCEVPGGWQERCVARLTLGFADGRRALVLSLAPAVAALPAAAPGGPESGRPDSGRWVRDLDGAAGARFVLRTGFADGRFLYLTDPASGGRWTGAWSSRVTAPYAVGVVLDADTLIVRVGARG